MNRIILIGNGFDLAHSIPTSYTHFLNYFWKSVYKKIKNDLESFDIHSYSEELGIHSYIPSTLIENIGIVINYTSNSIQPYQNGFPNIEEESYYLELQRIIKDWKLEFQFKNKFFKIITEKSYLKNWIDIENEYYTILKDISKNKYKQPSDFLYNYNIIKLNNDFNGVKRLLEHYLIRAQKGLLGKLSKTSIDAKDNISRNIYSAFQLNDFTEELKNKKIDIEYNKNLNFIKLPKHKSKSIENSDNKNLQLFNRLKNYTSEEETKKEIKEILTNKGAINYFDLIPNEVLFLNFNYTSTEKLYKDYNSHSYNPNTNKNIETNSIHIHGELESDNNPIIFGFGDELDDDYPAIEKLNENAYLENIKSMKYLETDNYKRLLEFLNSEEYQIFIFGHSCGISDKTLLNTLFEHENCVSIKPFYYQINEEEDNYSDIIKNISRNFNDKGKMRDVVVNKKQCEPLVPFS